MGKNYLRNQLFADGTSLFSAVNDSNISVSELNKDLELKRHYKLFSHENNLNQSILSYYSRRNLLFVLPLKSTLG